MSRSEHFWEGWHGTRYAENAEKIMQHGFSLHGAGGTGGSDFGAGVYATKDKGWAAEHAFGVGQQDRGSLMRVQIHAQNPHHGTDMPPHVQETARQMAEHHQMEHTNRLRGLGRSEEEIAKYSDMYKPEQFHAEALQHHGHDAWFHGGHSDMAVVFNPERIKPTGENYSYRDYYGDDGDEDEYDRWH